MDWNIHLRYTRNTLGTFYTRVGGMENFLFLLNHPPYLNRQRKVGRSFPAFTEPVFDLEQRVRHWLRGMRSALFLRSFLAALSLPNKVCNSICYTRPWIRSVGMGSSRCSQEVMLVIILSHCVQRNKTGHSSVLRIRCLFDP
jgi:hypothetical protein